MVKHKHKYAHGVPRAQHVAVAAKQHTWKARHVPDAILVLNFNSLNTQATFHFKIKIREKNKEMYREVLRAVHPSVDILSDYNTISNPEAAPAGGACLEFPDSGKLMQEDCKFKPNLGN